MRLEFSSVSENESFARVAVAAFVSQLDPTMAELTDIKTVVSEAVTNAIIHGYESDPSQKVVIETVIEGHQVEITILIPAWGWMTSKQRDSRFLPLNRNWNAQAWDLRSWKILWTVSR